MLLKYSLKTATSSQTPPSLWEELQEAGLDPASSLVGVQLRYKAVHLAVGSTVADYFLVTMIKNISKNDPMLSKEDLSEEEIKVRKQQVEEMSVRASVAEERLVGMHILEASTLSPKFLKLLDLLSCHKSESFCGVVFVEQRQVAVMLSWSMSRRPELSAWVKSGVLTGHAEASGSGNVAGMSLKAQKEVIIALRNKSINLRESGFFTSTWHFSTSHNQVFATSVAEEGLDIPVSYLYRH